MKLFFVKKPLLIFAILILFCLLNFTSCQRDIEPNILGIDDLVLPFGFGPTCNGVAIFEFPSLEDIQQQHKVLYTSYLADNEEEQTLIDWEEDKGFYSLRKKDQEMDEGLIPDDPNFSPFDYTSDPILETILNSEGMVIIEDFLYLWDDGCVIHRMPFDDCNDYLKMIEFKTFLNGYIGSLAEQEELLEYRNIDLIEDVDICSDSRFDFESISELNVDVDNNQIPPVANGTYCGVEVFVTHKVIAHDPLNKTIRLRFDANAIKPTGTNPVYSFAINSSNFNNVEVIDASLASTIGSTWDNLGGDDYVYSGEWFIIEVDYSTISQSAFIGVSLLASVSTLSGDSCQDSDFLGLSTLCPISISKEAIDARAGDWNLTVEGLGSNSNNNTIHWNFSDGSPSVTTQNTNTLWHKFPTPCSSARYGVVVSIEANGICKNTTQVEITSGDRCKRSQISESASVFFNGKKARMKIRVRRFTSGSLVTSSKRVKSVFRYRVSGTKTITSSGNIYKESGGLIFPICTQEQMNVLLPSANQSGKKSFTQGFHSSSIYSVDFSDPYAVTFEHNTGFSRRLDYSGTCSE